MVGRWTAGLALAGLLAATWLSAGCGGTAKVIAEAHHAARVHPPEIITVDARGRGDYASIQAAVDHAPPGATIHVQAGVYNECVEVRKPIVLEGDGPDATSIVSGTPWEGSVQDFVARAQAAQKPGGEQGRAALASLLHQYARPAVLVEDAEGVTITGVKMTLFSPAGKGASMADGVVMVNRAKVSVADCVVAGAWAYGLKLTNGSSLKLTDSLVAGIVTSGVEVTESQKAGTVEVSTTDFRRCGTGVETASDTPLTLKDCRFLRCDLAGVHYMMGAPVIRHCAFVRTHQGVSGESEGGATIEGNVFCLSDGFGVNVAAGSKAQIENNTFASNAFGVVVLKKPFDATIRANVFSDNGVAMLLPQDEEATKSGTGRIVGNMFWHNSSGLSQIAGDAQTTRQTTMKLPLPGGNETAPAMFSNPGELDYSMLPGSPALLKRVGAYTPLSTQSQWPEQPEETKMPRDATTPLGRQGS